MSADWKETNNEENQFSFIQEQIVPKKGNKTKKIIVIFVFTIVMAIIFGLIARYVFCISESFFNNILGVSEEKDTIKFPSEDPQENSKNQVDANIDTKNKNEGNKVDKVSEEEEKPIVIENSVEADVSDYLAMHSKINDVAALVNKSIVKITSAEKAVDWFNNDYESESVTTGIILAKDSTNLYILTSNNKIISTENIKVTFQDNIVVDGEFRGNDSELNLAVVILDVKQIPEGTLKGIEVAKLGESFLLTAGDPILALGNPNGYSSSMEIGMITNNSNSIYTIDNKIELFNTNINDNPNGEGVIVNLKGEIVGIITQKFKSNLNKNLNTVISISRVKPVIGRLVNNKPMAWLGIIGADMTAEIAKSYGLASGIYVTEVKAKSPAFNAGIKSGDVILAIDDKKTITMTALNNILMEYQPEDVVKLTLKRTTKEDNNETTMDVILGNKK